jgi:hypothetical protein
VVCQVHLVDDPVYLGVVGVFPYDGTRIPTFDEESRRDDRYV